jgi:hypothetical protein
MNPLQYTSDEMFSSTELIRKSKMVFDKLQKKEIEKAIILRDGKPSFMLIDFSQYEKLMKEYLFLKEDNNKKDPSSTPKKKISKESIQNISSEEEKVKSNKELNKQDLENALAQIDDLDLDNLNKDEPTEKEPLKEFWE